MEPLWATPLLYCLFIYFALLLWTLIVERTANRKIRWLAGCGIGTVLMALPVLWCGSVLFHEEIQAEITEWRARRWLTSTTDEVLAIVGDARLVEKSGPELSYSGTMYCVGLDSRMTFETEQTWDAIIDQHEQSLLSSKWKIEDSARFLDENEMLFYEPDEHYMKALYLEPLEEETQYQVRIRFEECRCVGEWFTPCGS